MSPKWAEVALGEVTDVLSGFAFDSKRFSDSAGLPLVRIRNVTSGRSETFFDGKYDPKFLVSDGDLLIGMDGEFKRARWQGGRALLNQRVSRIAVNDHRVDEGFLFHFLPTALDAIEARTPFVTVKHLSSKTLKAISMPLPPIEEQKRIAAILDKADELQAKRRAAIAHLDSLARAIFVDMFGDPARNPMDLPTVALGEIAEVQIGPFGSLLHSSDYVVGGTPLINPMHIVKGRITPNDDQTVEASALARLQRYLLRPDDVVMGRRGEMGRCALVGIDDPPMLCGSGSMIIRPDVSVANGTFLVHLLSSAAVKRKLEGSALGVTMMNLNASMMNQLAVPLPPLAAQGQFAAAVTGLVRAADSTSRHGLQLRELTSSLQANAFRGEL